MAVLKHSQIAAIAPTSPSNQVVGVIGSTTDSLFAISQIGTIPLTNTLQIFISPSGSDSNNGLTIGTPFATMSKALSITPLYDYQQQFSFQINIADGTYPESLNGPWIMPILKNSPIGAGNIIGNPFNPQNVVFSNAGGFSQQGQYQTYMDGLRQIGSSFDSGMGFFVIPQGGGNIAGGEGAAILVTNAICDTTNQVNSNVLVGQGGGVIDGINRFTPTGGITIQGSSGGSFARAASGGIVNVDYDFLVFPATYTYNFATVLTQFGAPEVVWTVPSGSTTNFAGVSGFSTDCELTASIITLNGVVTDIPGGAGQFFNDNTITMKGVNSLGRANRGYSGIPIPGVPVAANDLPAQTWGVFKDTSGGGVYVAYNDAGTIKKVALV